MMAPFFKYGLFGDEFSLIVAFVTGVGMGFFLERAGFGNARLLAAQFYFRDLRVLKVMFTAIVTAMVGLYVLGGFGLMDLSLIYLTPTFLAPQIVGGIILGIGFIIGGYCPGTSCVSAVTGRIDGMVYVAGMIGGLLGFAEVYPSIERFARSTGMGKITLPQLFDVPYGLLVFAVVLMALGAFVAAEWAEKKLGGKVPAAGSLLEPTLRVTPVRAFAVSLVALGAFAAIGGSPYRSPVGKVDVRELALEAGTKTDHVSAPDLADWIIEGRNDFILVDVREAKDFAEYHIPGAINVPLASLSGDFADRNERIVFYSDGGIHAAQAWLLLRSLGYRGVYLLFGGLEEWKDSVLFPTAPAAAASASEQIAFAKRAAVSKYFGGAVQGASASPGPAVPTAPKLTPAVPTDAPASPPPAAAKKKKKEGC
ncbi:hypothetical protein DB347_11185 [Opitutaceae bacterium EW11]|nr:hypothetical protein DB347_11185 [Opitutaceae bacterium EW11]